VELLDELSDPQGSLAGDLLLEMRDVLLDLVIAEVNLP
jgi:hypothetical protein